MQKTFKKTVSLLMCVLMVLSCFHVSVFMELGAIIAQAADTSITAGDINGDGSVNNKDLTRLMKYISGEDVDVVAVTVDTNGDGNVNNKDLTRLMKYISGEDVEIFPKGCMHELVLIEEVNATCEEVGHIAYWKCSLCEDLFVDETGATKITLDETVIEKLPHTEETIPGYPATLTKEGLTDGIKCSVCDKVIKEQEIIPISEYEIEYVISGNDTYLTKLMQEGKIENTNPATYSTEKGTGRLDELVVPGYTFEGWYDASGASGILVRQIEPGTTGKQKLYAKWTKEVYTITFDSPEVPWDSVTYTVDTGKTLTNPSWFGYTFVGWSENGKIVKDIPVGTIGNKTLHANWTSDRNKAVSKPLSDPEIIEDLDNNRFIFIYEIGEIENVPLNLIKDYGKSESNLELKEKIEYSQTVDEKFIETAATAVSNATTKTNSWTLSEDWNKSTSATNSHEEEFGKTDGKTDSQGVVQGSQYYVSNASGGSTSSSSSAGGSSSTSSKVTTDTSTGISDNYSRKSELDTSVDLSVEASVGAGYGPVKAEVKAGVATNTSTHDEEAFNCASYRDTYVGTYDESNSNSYWDTNSTASSSWNTTNSYQTSSSSSTTSEVSSAISEVIYDRWGYSSTEDVGGGSSATNSTDATKTDSREYISTIERSTEERETLTTEINKTFTTPGYYRLVTAGKLHVFAVVGYDVATRSYFTYTYSVLDSERKMYLDYSKTQSDFDDCENAILPFEVPYEVHEYISDVTARSNGLTIGLDGIVTAYKGTADYVVIPEYTSDSDGTSANEAIRVRGIAPGAFKGNTNIKAVSIPKYITEIPESAFEGCTSLESVFGYSLTAIGDRAFKDCALKNFTVDGYFTSIGKEAFAGVPEITVKADPSAIIKLKGLDADSTSDVEYAKKTAEEVVRAVIYSGAKRITADVTTLGSVFANEKIEIDASTEYFALLNNNTVNTYNNLQIESNAKETYLGGMNLVGNNDTPLKLNSEKVTLSKVTVENAPGFALVLPAENTDLYVYDTITLGSAGENAVISKNVNVEMATSGVTSKMKINGNYLVFGTLTDNSLIGFTKGEVIAINKDQFDSYLTSSVITFDANGGSVSEASRIVYYGQKYGTLPVPTRANYGFAGWFTAKEGGTQITADSSVTALVNQTLYARWTPNTFTLTYNANGGSVSPGTKTLTFGDTYGTLPTPTRNNYNFSGWYTAASGGTQVSASTKPSSATNVTIYAQWTPKQFTLTYNANGGSSSVATKTLTFGDSYGTLPTPKRDYYTFLGWYTAASGGTQVSAGTTPTSATNVTIYAQWKQNDVKGWVKSNEVPSGAQIIETKWSYTQRNYKESKNTSESGWTQYESYWVQSGSGSFNYASFPSGFDTGNWYYQNWNRSAYSSYENTTAKRTVSTAWAGYIYWHWMYDTNYANGNSQRAIYNKNGTGPDNGYAYKFFGAFDSTKGDYSSSKTYCNSQNITNYIVPERTSWNDCQGATRWFRFDYYVCNYTDYYKMFKYYQDVNSESTSDPTNWANTSNEVKWVKYRAK